MKAKVTLTIDSEIVEQARIYAEEKGISLDELIEIFLKSIVEKNNLTETL